MNPLIVESSSSKAIATLIFLHGLGDTGQGWASTMKYLAASLPQFRLVLPTAPTRPVTLNNHFPMPAWYDIFSLSLINHKVDEAGILQSQKKIIEIVEKEKQCGKKVFVGGFSQGAAIALQVGLQCSDVSGVVALSGYYALPDMTVKNQQVSIFMAHGTSDSVVDYSWGHRSYESLKSKNLNVIFKSYPGMAHESSIDELNDIANFLNEQMKQKSEL